MHRLPPADRNADAAHSLFAKMQSFRFACDDDEKAAVLPP
jgi:hypothetical protein